MDIIEHLGKKICIQQLFQWVMQMVGLRLSNKGFVFYGNTKLKMLGRISMDLIIIDISKVKNKIKLGDFVELYNKKFTIDKFADLTGTIPYRVITCISDRFLKIIYNENYI